MAEVTKCTAMAPYSKTNVSVSNTNKKSVTPGEPAIKESAFSTLIKQFPKNTYVKPKTDNYSPYVHGSSRSNAKCGISVKYEQPAKRMENTHTSSSDFFKALYKGSSFFKLLKDEQVPTLDALIKSHGCTYTELVKSINERKNYEAAEVEELIKITAGELPLFSTYVVPLSEILDMPAAEILKSGAMTEFEAGIFSDEVIFKNFISSCHNVIDWQKKEHAIDKKHLEEKIAQQDEEIKMYKEFLEDNEKNQRDLIQDLKKAEDRVSFFRLCTLLFSGLSLLLMILRFI